jgi:hypothetical protein
VGYGLVVPGHRYVADVKVYDRAATDLRPLGDGTPIVELEGTDEIVSAAWRTTCGQHQDASATGATGGGAGGAAGAGGAGGAAGAAGSEPQDAGDADVPPRADAEGPVEAIEYATVHVRGCAELVATGDAAGLRISLDAALAGLACGDGPGQVSSFSASAPGVAAETAACGDAVVLEPLEPDRSAVVEVRAFETTRTTPSWSTRCFGVPRAGTTLDASCDPLSSQGTLAVDLGALFAGDAHCEGSGADAVEVISAALALPGAGPRVVTATSCAATLSFGSLERGSYVASVVSRLESGAPGPGAQCSGTVVPGEQSAMQCAKLPAP